MNRAFLQQALANRNVQAFLRAIRAGESSQGPEAYHVRWGGLGKPPAYFDDLSKHPRIMEPTTGGKLSSAAGAYQATWTTWSEELARYHWPDFSEQCQDEFAVARLVTRKALSAVLAGEFERACSLCKNEWTSLPGGPEENKATARAQETYLRWGGLMEPAETPAPAAQDDAGEAIAPETAPTPQPIPQEARMPFPLIPLITAFGPQLLQLIPQLGSLFGSGSDVQVRNVKAATMAVDAIVKATDSPNLQAAIEAMEANPEAAQAARAAVAEVMTLVEVGGGIEAARKAANAPDQVPPSKNPAVWIALMIIPLVYFAAIVVLLNLGKGDFSSDIQMMVVTAIFSGALGSITGFFLGSSLGSQRKTAMLGKE